jgi:hypothetical protein
MENLKCERKCDILEQMSNQYEKVVQQNKCLQQELQPFRDEYFASLSMVQIAELAKKSIRITADNSNMQDLLETIYYTVNGLDKDIKQKIEEIIVLF